MPLPSVFVAKMKSVKDCLNMTETIIPNPRLKRGKIRVKKMCPQRCHNFAARPADKVGPRPFTMFFAESTDLRNWREIDGAVIGKDFYTGGPMLRHHDGWYYFFHLEGDYKEGFHEVVQRSRDLRNWERSPHIVMDFGDIDRRLHPKARFTDAQKSEIAAAKNINVSDHDFCEYGGKLICSYSWGDQHGHEFLALAEADCTEKEFCESYFVRQNEQ